MQTSPHRESALDPFMRSQHWGGGAISLADAHSPWIVQYNTVPENPMLLANITALCLIERELLSIQVYIVGIGILDLFGSCDLDLTR